MCRLEPDEDSLRNVQKIVDAIVKINLLGKFWHILMKKALTTQYSQDWVISTIRLNMSE